MANENVQAALGERYTDGELQTEKVVALTRTDLVILSWGHESVSFVPGSEEAAEFAVAERKIDQALERNAKNAVEQVSLTLQDLLILSWGHESVSFVPGSDSAKEFSAAEAKIDKALDELRNQLAGK
ncbi:TPA: hypothetical protein L6A34_31405 [Pseudomonas aeruginosa]|uniref:hypothetical protein n=1 Tax=Pseudomonas aeruginosa TaxID=287 RepID=UPI00071C0573|nr:hypothetical protein [Pseudomonas aeruginosa]EKF7416831.1 hypothetical protein [Pseudomonas aeruginosa]ELQ8317583.1 hypothetical protein [Pseudomonas aeruginosa]KSM65116.1 hypothetical protein APA70_22240 [Pseudomonas aeruginosa]CAI9794836.1 hypothetical protein PAER4782_34625 [Pseudomonas aeruginosa]CAI9912225.1 hypothetical protein PAER4782_34625 [Pseudomonas aeruginosa]